MNLSCLLQQTHLRQKLQAFRNVPEPDPRLNVVGLDLILWTYQRPDLQLSLNRPGRKAEAFWMLPKSQRNTIGFYAGLYNTRRIRCLQKINVQIQVRKITVFVEFLARKPQRVFFTRHSFELKDSQRLRLQHLNLEQLVHIWILLTADGTHPVVTVKTLVASSKGSPVFSACGLHRPGR